MLANKLKNSDVTYLLTLKNIHICYVIALYRLCRNCPNKFYIICLGITFLVIVINVKLCTCIIDIYLISYKQVYLVNIYNNLVYSSDKLI